LVPADYISGTIYATEKKRKENNGNRGKKENKTNKKEIGGK
jgi:hypothetical protein